MITVEHIQYFNSMSDFRWYFINNIVPESERFANKVPIKIAGMGDDELCDYIVEEYEDFKCLILIPEYEGLRYRSLNIEDTWFELVAE